jgi:hypothetical protein
MVGLGVALAGLLQCIGWRIEEPERAVLVRIVGLVAGVMVTGAMASIVVSRHSPRRPLAWKRRLKRAVVPLVLVSLWAAAGAVYALAR